MERPVLLNDKMATIMRMQMLVSKEKKKKKGEKREGYEFIEVHPCPGKIKKFSQQATNTWHTK